MAIHEVQLCNSVNDQEVVLMNDTYGSRGGGLLDQNNWFSYPLQEQHDNLHQQQTEFLQKQQQVFDHQSSSSSSHHFHQSISAHLHRQRMELDYFINLQNDGLRTALQEQRTQHIAFLVKKYESMTRLLLEVKEDEITKAENRTLELQNFLSNMEVENQTWQRVAKENESAIESLQRTIERVKESLNSSADDAESFCHMIAREEEEDSCTKNIACRCCKTRRSCVIVLPCRHLCSCSNCEVFLDSCPVCGKIKRGSIEAI